MSAASDFESFPWGEISSGEVELSVELSVELGAKRYKLAEVSRWRAGTLILLGKEAGSPLNIYANNQHIGRGRAVEIGSRFGVQITELFAPSSVKENGE